MHTHTARRRTGSDRKQVKEAGQVRRVSPGAACRRRAGLGRTKKKQRGDSMQTCIMATYGMSEA